jgi:hypothetical protein
MPRGNKKIIISATDQLQRYWEKGFFKGSKTVADTDKQLAKAGYNFSPAELGMALMRAPYLTRKGKRGAYTYIQKGPYKQNG